VVWHGTGPGDIPNVDGLTGLFKSFIGPLPELAAAEQNFVHKNDLVLVRLVVSATVEGTLTALILSRLTAGIARHHRSSVPSGSVSPSPEGEGAYGLPPNRLTRLSSVIP
jgi:hypothetical protein